MTTISKFLSGDVDDQAAVDAAYKRHIVSMIASGQGPAHIHQRGTSNPLLVADLCKAWVENEPQKTARWREVSDKLEVLGYRKSANGFLIPFATETLPQDARPYGREIEKEMDFDVDPGEVAWLLKQYPQFAAKAFGVAKADLQLGDDTLGGVLVPVSQGRLIDFLRGRSALIAAGAREVPLPPSGNISYPRLKSDPTFTWTDPDSTADGTATVPDFGVVRLVAKSLRGFCVIPNDLVRYSSPAAELVIRAALGGGGAIAEDSAFLENAGSSIAPRGLRQFPQSAPETPTDGSVTLHVAGTPGANGDTLEPEDIATIASLYEESKDPDPATAWIMRPTLFSALANKRSDAVNAGDAKGPFMFPASRGDAAVGLQKILNGVRAVTTVQLSRNDAKGSATNLHVLLYGNFGRMLVGRSGAAEISASEHIKFLSDKLVVRCILRSDMNCEALPSFVIVRNLLQA